MAGCKMMDLRAISCARLATLVGLATGFALVSAASQELTVRQQATFSMSTVQRSPTAPVADLVQSGTVPTAANPPADGTRSLASIGRINPLWTIPLTSLTATRERPIFSPSRRPPVVVELASVQSQPSPPTNQPRRPLLALVGAIAGETEGFAIFLDETTKGIVRLKTGESHSGWTLRIVKGREATLQKGRETAILAIPNPPAK